MFLPLYMQHKDYLKQHKGNSKAFATPVSTHMDIVRTFLLCWG